MILKIQTIQSQLTGQMVNASATISGSNGHRAGHRFCALTPSHFCLLPAIVCEIVSTIQVRVSAVSAPHLLHVVARIIPGVTRDLYVGFYRVHGRQPTGVVVMVLIPGCIFYAVGQTRARCTYATYNAVSKGTFQRI
jgi:hypothetical protein